MLGNEHCRNSGGLGEGAGVHWTRTAKRDEHQFAGVVAFFGRADSDSTFHIRIGDPYDTKGGLLEREPEWLAYLLKNRLSRGFNVEFDQTAGKVRGIQTAKYKIGIGHCRLSTAF